MKVILYTNHTECLLYLPSIHSATIESVWDISFVQSICELMYTEKHILFGHYIHPANDWMSTPDLGQPQFYLKDTTVMTVFFYSAALVC